MRPDLVRRSLVLLGVAFLLGAAVPRVLRARASEASPQHEVEGRLMCYCGCSDLTVRVCTCGTADTIRREIAGRLANGESPDQVVAAFVARHGEQIRSAPLKSGFDLVAWVTPFVALLLAGATLIMVVRRWGRSRGVALATAPAPSGGGAVSPPTPEEQRALERVRREMREGR